MAFDFFVLMGIYLIYLVANYYFRKRKKVSDIITLIQLKSKKKRLEFKYVTKSYLFESIDHFIERMPKLSLTIFTLIMMVEAYIIYSIII